MKQTAVEWLVEQILCEVHNYDDVGNIKYSEFQNKFISCTDLSEYVIKAKAMEKKQITETFVKVSRAHQEALGNKLSLQDMIDYKKIAEVYYNEEYETKKD